MYNVNTLVRIPLARKIKITSTSLEKIGAQICGRFWNCYKGSRSAG
jgi:hypothetical protein